MRKLSTVLAIAAAPLALIVAGPAAAADFLGDTLNGSYNFPGAGTVFSNQGNQVVAPTASFTFRTGTPNVTAIVSAASVLLTFDATGGFTGAAFNGVVLTDLTRGDITGFTLDSATTLAGFDQSRLSFTANSLSLNLQGLANTRSDRVLANVSFAGASAVPEPAAWALMLVGFGVIGAALRRARPTLTVSYSG